MDFLATKGIEYVLIIGYLLLLVPFWWLLRRVGADRSPVAASVPAERRGGWFLVPEDLRFHPGHAWVHDEGDGLYRVGINDFARRLLGSPARLALPRAGDRLQQGSRGWSLGLEGHDIDMLSPIDGEVTEVNTDVVGSPALVGEDPYGDGWLLKVRADAGDGRLRNLLPAPLARSLMEGLTGRLSAMSGGELGAVLQDGGIPVDGFARQLAGDDWHLVAAELLLTADGQEDTSAPDRAP